MTEMRGYAEKLDAARTEAIAATMSVRSKDRILTVTVTGQGELKDIQFHSTDYAAMAPAQLSAVLVETINSARKELSEKIRGLFSPLENGGSALRSVLTGGSDLDRMVGPLRELLAPQAGTDTDDEEEWIDG
ncbi:YbaB/EbfC family nucleoid-associated protein [Actinacidiphila guanduensis]|nr:YbaB/EbfC family nucleoid-associated protein [Actinacidiphila guanduensis]